MPHIDKHAPGAFAWIELSTTDQNAAKTFYTSLLGWSFEDSPMGPDEVYTMFQLEGRNAGAAYTQRPDEAAMGIPPHWNLYFSVASADMSSARAAELGGQVFAGPFDVADHGRMAVIGDPTGGAFCVWEAKTNHGLGVIGQPGAFCWADFSTPDQAKAAEFYSGLFGYKLPPGDGGYLHLQNGEEFIGGIQPATHRQPGMPTFWLIYLQVESCAASTAKARELGAGIFEDCMVIPKTGTMTILADPQGAVFAMFEPEPRGEL